MASLSRIFKLCSSSKRLISPQCLANMRLISTSNKKDDTTTVVSDVKPTTHTGTEIQQKKKYFYDYGYGADTEKEEHNMMNATFFIYVSLALGVPIFYLMYAPNDNLHDWAQREAYLELRRREKLGLPLIDPNYVDPSQIYLPSDEELGDTEIII